jgi:hypothetical protein
MVSDRDHVEQTDAAHAALLQPRTSDVGAGRPPAGAMTSRAARLSSTATLWHAASLAES